MDVSNFTVITEQMTALLKSLIPEKRYMHSVGVMNTSYELAKLYNADTQNAIVAGYLHDCAKSVDIEQAIKLCEKYNVIVDGTEITNPALIHAPCGVCIAREKFGIADDEILNAIRFHTVGRKKMSKLEKIVYLADMIEPLRCYDGVDSLRKKSRLDLNQAVFEAMRMSILWNTEKNKIVHTGTVEAYNYMLEYENCGKEE